MNDLEGLLNFHITDFLSYMKYVSNIFHVTTNSSWSIEKANWKMPLLVTQHYTFFAFQFFFSHSIIVTAMEFIPSKTWFFTSVCRKNLEAKMLKLANKLYHIRHNKIMGELKSFAVIIHPVVRKHHVVIIYFLESF